MMAVLPCPLESPLFPWLSRYSSRHFIARFRHQSRLVLDYHKTHYVRSGGVLHIDDGWYDLLLSAGKLDSLCDILSPDALEDPEKAKTVVDCQAEYPWVRCEVNDETLRASCAKLEDGQALLICSKVSTSPENRPMYLMTDSGSVLISIKCQSVRYCCRGQCPPSATHPRTRTSSAGTDSTIPPVYPPHSQLIRRRLGRPTSRAARSRCGRPPPRSARGLAFGSQSSTILFAFRASPISSCPRSMNVFSPEGFLQHPAKRLRRSPGQTPAVSDARTGALARKASRSLSQDTSDTRATLKLCR